MVDAEHYTAEVPPKALDGVGGHAVAVGILILVVADDGVPVAGTFGMEPVVAAMLDSKYFVLLSSIYNPSQILQETTIDESHLVQIVQSYFSLNITPIFILCQSISRNHNGMNCFLRACYSLKHISFAREFVCVIGSDGV